MKIKIFGIFLLLALTASFLLPLNFLRSQEGNKVSLSLSPLMYEVAANPGEKFQKEVRVTNVSGRNLLVTVKTEDFVAGGERGQPRIVKEEEKGAFRWSLKKWIRLEENQFELKDGETKSLYFYVEIPPEAEPGGHYGMVRLANVPSEAKDKTKVGLVGSVGTLILLKVKGKVIETGKVRDFYTVKFQKKKEPKKVKYFVQRPVGFEVRFKNTGTVHYQPKGTVEVKSLLGKKKSFVIGDGNVLPESIRKFNSKWKSPPLIGRFVAKAKLKYGSKERTATSKPYVFYIIPWKIVLIVLAGLLILGFLIWRQIALSRKLKHLQKIR